jgi:hypothetical protein
MAEVRYQTVSIRRTETMLSRARLSDHAPQRTTPNRIMKRNKNCSGRRPKPLLDNPMIAVLTDGKESVVFENGKFPSPKELGAYSSLGP